MCESNASSSSLSGPPILKISSCFNEACSKTTSKLHIGARLTTVSLSSDETVSSSELTSVRSSRTSSSGYSGMSSLCEHFEVEGTSTPSLTKRRERGSLAKLFTDADIPNSTSTPDDKETASPTTQPSLKMIRRLKRLSDAWSNMARCTDDIIIDRLKKGREEAIKKHTYLEVYMYPVDIRLQVIKSIFSSVNDIKLRRLCVLGDVCMMLRWGNFLCVISRMTLLGSDMSGSEWLCLRTTVARIMSQNTTK